MTEVALWNRMRPVLQSLGLDPHRVENSLGVGTPDVNYTQGCIELKDVVNWPANGGPLLIRKLRDRPEQVVWLTRRWQAGGLCWLMIRINREVVLIRGRDSAAVRDGLTREEMRGMAAWRTPLGGMISAELKADLGRVLTGGIT